MPEPNRTPWLVDPHLARVTVGHLIEQQAVVGLACHACRHRTAWGDAELRRRFATRPSVTFRQLGPRLRCSACKSDWVEVGYDRPGRSPPVR